MEEGEGDDPDFCMSDESFGVVPELVFLLFIVLLVLSVVVGNLDEPHACMSVRTPINLKSLYPLCLPSSHEDVEMLCMRLHRGDCLD